MSNHIHTHNCSRLLGSLSDYIDGDLKAEICAQIEEHIKECDNCRIVVNTLQKTVELYETSSNETAMLPEAIRERLFLKLNLEDLMKKG